MDEVQNEQPVDEPQNQNGTRMIELACNTAKKELIESINAVATKNGLPSFIIVMILNEIVLENKMALLNDIVN